jgi:hypothetical protein
MLALAQTKIEMFIPRTDDGLSGPNIERGDMESGRNDGYQNYLSKKFVMQMRKLLHSLFCGGRMRAVQGLEDSARSSV